MAWFGIPLIGQLLGIGEKAADRLLPDRNKARDQAHERATSQADITREGERARNHFTPRAIIMYAMVLPVVYNVVFRPFLIAFAPELAVHFPEVPYKEALAMLAAMLGLGG